VQGNLGAHGLGVKVTVGGRTEVLTWNLPYEIIVVGLYDGECETD